MSLTLSVDGERWRTHLREVAGATPGLVPVAKGNGYGFGLGRLARRVQWLADQGLGCDTLAVGTYEELPEVASRFAGDLLVLTPWRPFGAALDVDPSYAGRVIHTVGRPEDLCGLLDRQPHARYVLELLTSMKRHGLTPRELRDLAWPEIGDMVWPGWRCTCRSPGVPTSTRCIASSTTSSPRAPTQATAPPSGSATSPATSWRRSGRPTPTSRSGPGSGPTSGSGTATRCG